MMDDMTPDAEKTLENSDINDKAVKPKGWIRWSGLIVIVVIVGAGFAAQYLGLNGFVKSQLENQASQAWGAKVEIGELNVSLSPLALSIRQISVTDPDKPMQNLVVIEQLQASIDLYHLVVGRYVIDDVLFNGLALHQARQTSGALAQGVMSEPKEAPVADGAESSDKPAQEKSSDKKSSDDAMSQVAGLLSPEELLKKEPLKTLEKSEEIQQKIGKVSDEWTSLEGNLPEGADLDAYQKSFNELTAWPVKSLKELEERKAKYDALEKKLNIQQKAVDKASKLLKDDLPDIKKDVVVLKGLPEEDYERLVSHYSLDQQGASNLTGLIFGEEVQGWLDEALYWYEKAQPYLESDDEEVKGQEKSKLPGQMIAFKEFDPQPSFRIKRIEGSAHLYEGDIGLQVLDVTDQQESKIPLTYTATYQPPKQGNALLIEGLSNLVDNKNPLNQVKFNWNDYALKNWVLSESDTMPVKISDGLTDVSGELQLLKQGKMNGLVKLDYQPVNFSVGDKANSETKQYLKPALDEIDQFMVKTRLSGSIKSPNIKVDSDLDRRLQKSMSKVLNAKAETYKKQLKSKISGKTKQQLAQIDEKVAELTGQESNLAETGQSLASLNRAAFEKKIKALKKRWLKQKEDKAKAELDAKKKAEQAKLKKKADAEKKKREKAAKKELEKKLKKLQF